MAGPVTQGSPTTFLGPDPGRIIRIWVALLLRFGIGLSLLGTGLASYRGMPVGGGPGGFPGPGGPSSAIDPFLSGLPYLAIGLGLGLILGFLTTASAIGAGFFSLIIPFFAIIQVALVGTSNGFGVPYALGNDPFFHAATVMMLPNLVANAAMIWLSPLENNPFSVDTLIFGRNEIEPVEPRMEISPASDPIPEEEPPIRIGE